MSQMPDKLWVSKDSKYNTQDGVYAYQYDFAQGIEDEGGLENFVEYVNKDMFIEELEANRLVACDNQTNEEAEREMEFVTRFMKEHKRQPTYSDCIEITRKETIEEVCDYIRSQNLQWMIPDLKRKLNFK